MALALLALGLSSCASLSLLDAAERNAADLGFYEIPDGRGICARSLDVRYTIVNGNEPELWDFRVEPAVKVEHTNIDPLLIERDELRQFYVAQSDANSCYAATLTTIWRAGGLAAEQSQFVDAARTSCSPGLTSRATFLQIMNAAFFVRTGERHNYLTRDATSLNDLFTSKQIRAFQHRQFRNGGFSTSSRSLNFAPLVDATSAAISNRIIRSIGISPPQNNTPFQNIPNVPALNSGVNFASSPQVTAPSLYRALTWHRTNDPSVEGGIFPVGSTAELAVHFSDGAFIMVGLSSDSVGHTALVSGMEFLPAGSVASNRDGGNEYTILENTRVTRIRLLDPARPDDPDRWYEGPIDHFFEEARFIIAIYTS